MLRILGSLGGARGVGSATPCGHCSNALTWALPILAGAARSRVSSSAAWNPNGSDNRNCWEEGEDGTIFAYNRVQLQRAERTGEGAGSCDPERLYVKIAPGQFQDVALVLHENCTFLCEMGNATQLYS